MEAIYGNWVQSFNNLPQFLMVLDKWVLGTIYRMDVSPTPLHGEVFFERVFWAFKSCIDGFAHCKPLVQVDGTFLTEKFKGTLLLAVAQDGNSYIFPVAFAIVEGETLDAWNFFLKHLREHVCPQEGICIISDRHAAIKGAYENPANGWHDPPSSHVYCIRHIAQNFSRQFKEKNLRRYAVNMGYAPSTSTYRYWRKEIASANKEALRWLDNIPRDKWTQAYDGGCRWGHMTSNLAEAMNSAFKKIRMQPITALVQATYYKCGQLFGRRGEQSAAVLTSGQVYSEACQKRIVDAMLKANTHIVTKFDRQRLTSSVEETEDPNEGRAMDHFAVDLISRSCNCGRFQALRLPCSHAIAACSKFRISYQDYIHLVYKAVSVCNVYANPFPVIPSKSLWPTYEGDRVVARSNLKRTKRGRPKKNRVRTEMDEFGKPDRSCGLCKVPGHNAGNCPNAGGPSGSH